MDLNHLYLRVRDLDASLSFYRRFFGFGDDVAWQGETCVVRNGDGFALALTPDPAPPAWPGGLHFGFVLDDVEAARRVVRALEAAEVALVEPYEEPGFVVAKVHDPDGYLVEVEAGVPEHPPA